MQRPRGSMGLAVAFAALFIVAAPAHASTSGRGGVPLAAAFDCERGCTFDTRPVCGTDGEWYQNECLAACSGDVEPADVVLCDGKPLPFMDMRPGPAGAESAPLNASSLVVPPQVFTQYLKEGFRYVGRIRLARDFGPRPVPSEVQPAPDRDADGDWVVKAVRCTPEGDVYIGNLKVPSKPLKLESFIPPWMNLGRAAVAAPPEANATLLSFASAMGVVPPPSALRGGARAAGAGGLLAPRLKDAKEKTKFEGLLADFFGLFTSSASSAANGASPAAAAAAPASAPAAAAADGAAFDEADGADAAAAPAAGRGARRLAHARALKELVGGDDRTDCERGFPYTAIGQIQVVDGTGLYICTGTLIAPDKVLTAGHCVWNIKRGAFYYNLSYAPGRYRDGGNVVSPWGVVPWKSVTVFDSFKKNPSSYDIAIVTLAKPLGSLTGYMGLASGCGRNLQLTTAGYPQDKSQGTCMASSCLQRALDCDSPVNTHTCDTKNGMSGSPLWDGKHRVRMIHVAGLEDTAENRATTLTQFLVNTVSKW
ncbi:hypothetical protein Rsub_09123 [Raphidocelis subcapitata]|uniref:Serine protease n=1 Tax=Raphidocelis subcapitata TaxID=307507 RepID=A0A2V0PF78_9CHLO|nr:hypothetical protein Rsub_09123 [Raphidocelis subcapitata]|eukprot:GBF96540.1 hypothetical protein Rsub_09123 [Raphidocelis subcapitata]